MYARSRESGLPPSVVASTLRSILQPQMSEEIGSLRDHDVHFLIGILDSSNEVESAEVAQLEWIFLPLLRGPHYGTRALQRALATEPELFVDFLKVMYRGNDQEREPTEEDRTRAKAAVDLLHDWKSPPGVLEDGSVSEGKLSEWVSRARELAEASGRLRAADSHLGQVLSAYPAGEDGIWPHEALRNVLDEVASQDLADGIARGLFNSRGVTTKAIGEGGTQERDLAANYARAAEALQDGWPFTAAMLRDLEKTYSSYGGREDLRVELDELRGF